MAQEASFESIIDNSLRNDQHGLTVQKAHHITAVMNHSESVAIDWLLGNGLVEAVATGYTISKSLHMLSTNNHYLRNALIELLTLWFIIGICNVT